MGIILNTNVMVIVRKLNQSKNNFIQINHIKRGINNPKKSDTSRSELAIAINFISSKYTDKERVMLKLDHI